MSKTERMELGVFFHMLYELNKGLRKLSLFTCPDKYLDKIKSHLTKCNYVFIVENLVNGSSNIFFGDEEAINVIKSFGKDSLRNFTPEEDFILGVLLGYSQEQQCKRFLRQKEKEYKSANVI